LAIESWRAPQPPIAGPAAAQALRPLDDLPVLDDTAFSVDVATTLWHLSTLRVSANAPSRVALRPPSAARSLWIRSAAHEQPDSDAVLQPVTTFFGSSVATGVSGQPSAVTQALTLCSTE